MVSREVLYHVWQERRNIDFLTRIEGMCIDGTHHETFYNEFKEYVTEQFQEHRKTSTVLRSDFIKMLSDSPYSHLAYVERYSIHKIGFEMFGFRKIKPLMYIDLECGETYYMRKMDNEEPTLHELLEMPLEHFLENKSRFLKEINEKYAYPIKH